LDRLQPLTLILIAINVLVFVVLGQTDGTSRLDPLALWPLGSGFFRVWQPLTSAFLHGNGTHIFFNMFGLFMFGRDVERALGRPLFLTLYFAAALSASATQLAVWWLAGDVAAMEVGASGALFGVMLAYAWLFPRQKLILLFPPIPIPAWLFVTGYAAIELASGVFGWQVGVAHFAHLGGLAGAAAVLALRRASTV
jgi:membrane associated rhomboid family serine protease